jgi:hypothetical protein
MSLRISLALAAILCVAAAARGAQEQGAGRPAPESLPAFSSESNLVLVPFNVVRDAHFIRDIKADDFVLLQDGKIRDFSVFDSPGAGRRREPVELTVLFDTTQLTEVEIKSGNIYTAWNREGMYAWVGKWTDAESRALLLNGTQSVLVSVYHFDHQQLHQLCRLASEPKALTNAIHRLLEPIAPAEAIPLALPPNRKTYADLVVEQGGSKPDPKHPVTFHTPSWTMEAAIATLEDSFSAPDRAIRLMAVFSQGQSVTTTKAQDVADRALALGVPVYPVLLGADIPQGQGAPIRACDVTNPNYAVCTDREAINRHRFGDVGELTGGRAYYPGSIDEKLVSDVLVVMRNQGLFRYAVGFVPEASGRSRIHRLEIKLKSKSSGAVRGGKRAVEY